MPETIKISKKRIIIKAVIVAAIMLAVVIAEYFAAKLKIISVYNSLMEEKKEVRAWLVKMAMYILPFVSVALVGMLAYFKKIDGASYASKAVCAAFVGILFFVTSVVYIADGFGELELLEAKSEIQAQTEYLTLVMNIFLRNTVGFAVVGGYFAIRAHTGDTNEPASAEDCDDDTHKDVIEAE